MSQFRTICCSLLALCLLACSDDPKPASPGGAAPAPTPTPELVVTASQFEDAESKLSGVGCHFAQLNTHINSVEIQLECNPNPENVKGNLESQLQKLEDFARIGRAYLGSPTGKVMLDIETTKVELAEKMAVKIKEKLAERKNLEQPPLNSEPTEKPSNRPIREPIFKPIPTTTLNQSVNTKDQENVADLEQSYEEVETTLSVMKEDTPENFPLDFYKRLEAKVQKCREMADQLLARQGVFTLRQRDSFLNQKASCELAGLIGQVYRFEHIQMDHENTLNSLHVYFKDLGKFAILSPTDEIKERFNDANYFKQLLTAISEAQVFYDSFCQTDTVHRLRTALTVLKADPTTQFKSLLESRKSYACNLSNTAAEILNILKTSKNIETAIPQILRKNQEIAKTASNTARRSLLNLGIRIVERKENPSLLDEKLLKTQKSKIESGSPEARLTYYKESLQQITHLSTATSTYLVYAIEFNEISETDLDSQIEQLEIFGKLFDTLQEDLGIDSHNPVPHHIQTIKRFFEDRNKGKKPKIAEIPIPTFGDSIYGV